MKRKLTLLALLLFGPLWDGSSEALAAASHRLGPGAERSVGRCVGLEQPKLTEAVELRELHVERDHVRLILSDGSTSWTVSLYAPDDPREAARRTAGGALVTVDPIPGEALDTLAARLEACGPKIPFIREVDPIDTERRASEVRTLTERLSERLGRGDARPTSEEELREDLQAILADVRAGRDETALAALGLEPDALGFDFGLESDNQESFASMPRAFMLALGAMLVLLIVQFRSSIQWLLVFLAIPFSFFGVFGGLLLTDNQISFFVMLGLLGPEGRRAGLLIDESLGTDNFRIAVFGKR